MKTVREKTGMSIEPSAAVPIATILEGKVNPSGKKVGIIVSGGNVDLDRIP
jgi:threonine dehydratase